MSFNHNFILLGGCCQWPSQLTDLHAVSNLLIALTYYSIPAFLIYWRKQGEARSSNSFVLLGACCFGIGTTQLMAAGTTPPASDLPSSEIEAVTAAISLWAAAKFVPLIPQILACFSPEEIAGANDAAFANNIKTIGQTKTVDLSLENPAILSQTEIIEIQEQLLREIASKQQIESQMQQANSRFQQLVESSPIGIVFWDASGKITEANNTLLDIIGYTQEDLRSGKINWQPIALPELINTDARPDPETLGEWESGRVGGWGEWESGRMPNSQCPMPNSQCPMPNSQCPIPNAQFPTINSSLACARYNSSELTEEDKLEGKRFICSLQLQNFLSYGSEGEQIELQPLNVSIGPNASGKSNLIEAIALLKATPLICDRDDRGSHLRRLDPERLKKWLENYGLKITVWGTSGGWEKSGATDGKRGSHLHRRRGRWQEYKAIAPTRI